MASADCKKGKQQSQYHSSKQQSQSQYAPELLSPHGHGHRDYGVEKDALEGDDGQQLLLEVEGEDAADDDALDGRGAQVEEEVVYD